MDIQLEEDDSSDEEYQPGDEEEDETAEEVSGGPWEGPVGMCRKFWCSKAECMLLP